MTQMDVSSNGGDADVGIDDETVAKYRSDGAVCIRNALGSEWIEAIEKVHNSFPAATSIYYPF